MLLIDIIFIVGIQYDFSFSNDNNISDINFLDIVKTKIWYLNSFLKININFTPNDFYCLLA